MEKVRIGVIGNLHLNNIAQQPKLELTAVCDIIPERAHGAAEKYGCRA